MINKVTLIGNLGKDPEVRKLESGSTVAKFSLATNENYKDKNGEWQTQTEWHDIVAWGLLAERAERDLKKGKLVYIEGKLTHRKYEDKDGNPRKITEVRAIVLRLLERRENGEGDYNKSSFPNEKDAPAHLTASEKKTATSTVSQDDEDDGLPF